MSLFILKFGSLDNFLEATASELVLSPLFDKET